MGVAKFSDFGPLQDYISVRRKIGGKLLLMTNRKSTGTKIGDLE